MATITERKAALNAELRELAGKVSSIIEKPKSEITEDDNTALKSLTAQGKAKRAQLETLDEAGEFQSWASQSAGSAVKRTEYSQEFTDDADKDQEKRAQDKSHNSAYKSVFEHYMRGGLLPAANNPMTANDIKILKQGAMKAGLNEGTESSGGFTVPEDFQSEVLKKEPGLVSLWDNVRHVPTSRDVLVFPVVRYTTDNKKTAPHGLTWTGEIPASASTADVTDQTFGQVRIPVNVAMAGQKLSNSLIEDSATDIMGLTALLFRENIMQDLENVLAQGTGSGQPEGITINSTAQTNYSIGGSTTVPTTFGLNSAYWGVPAQYRNSAKCGWVFNSNTGKEIAKLVDGNGRFIWERNDQFGRGIGAALQDGTNGTPVLYGKAVYYSEQMPDIASNAYYAWFGDLNAYIVADRVGMSIRVLNELYAETDQVKVLLRLRVGGQLASDWRGKLIKAATS